MKYIILCFIVSSCAIMGPDIEKRQYCKRRAWTQTCPGTHQVESSLDWLVRNHKRYRNEDN